MRVRPWLPALLGALPLAILLLVGLPGQVSRLADPCMQWDASDEAVPPSTAECPGGMRGSGLTREEAFIRLAFIQVLTLVALVLGVFASWKETPRLALAAAFVLLLESIPYLMSGAAIFHWFAAGMLMLATRLIAPLDFWSANGIRALGGLAGVGLVALLARIAVSATAADLRDLFSILVWLIMLGLLVFVALAGLWPRPTQDVRPVS